MDRRFLQRTEQASILSVREVNVALTVLQSLGVARDDLIPTTKADVRKVIYSSFSVAEAEAEHMRVSQC